MIFTTFFSLYIFSPVNNFIKYQYNKFLFLRKLFVKQNLITDPNYEFYIKNKKKFELTFLENSNVNIILYNSYIKYNSNIDSEFYNKEIFQELLKQESNDIETKWKTRILITNTPRGNIIIYYDAFKQGFAYYSDSNGIPYNILNAVAMQYVIKYRCRNFFIDNKVTQEFSRNYFKDSITFKDLILFDSVLIPIYFEEENKKEKKGKILYNNSNAPFAKFKKNGLSQSGTTLVKVSYKIKIIQFFHNYLTSMQHFLNKYIFTYIKKEEKTIKEFIHYDKEYQFNKFIYLGKISNFNFLKKNKQNNKLNDFQSNLLDDICAEAAIQEEVLNYSSYKKILQNQVVDNKITTLVKQGIVNNDLAEKDITNFGPKEAYEAGIYDVAKVLYH